MTPQEDVETTATVEPTPVPGAPRIGFGVLGNRPDEIVELARHGESLGFSRIWMGDHLCQPENQESSYPYSPVSMTLQTVDYLDPLAMAAAIAGATTRLEIMTAVFLLPMHHPLQIARTLLTLQTVAKGRFVFGAGIGWMPEEFAALGVPFKRRGRRIDEALRILRDAQAGGVISHRGTEFAFEPLTISHRAVPVPLVVGGSADVAFRRAAEFGDGWVSTPDVDRDGLLRIRDRIEQLRREHGTADRPFTYYVRLQKPDPAIVASLRPEGFTDFNIGTVDLFPRDRVATMTPEEKFAALDRTAHEFDLTPP